MSKLTNKQKVFCQEYTIDVNATQAAIRAGYSKKNADVIGAELLGKTWVSAYIQELMDARANRTEIKADDILKELLLIAKTDLSKAYDETGNLLPIHKIPEETRRAIAGIKVFDEFEGYGKERVKVGEVREIKFWDKPKSLELLGKHLKLFTDRVEHEFKDGLADRLAAARKRRAK